MANCKECIRFKTCKFVEKNKEFTKQMYPMFEHLEWNNLEEVFFKMQGLVSITSIVKLVLTTY